MKQEIIIKRAGFMLGEIKEQTYSYRKHTKRIEEGKARIISPRLAIYKHDKGSSWSLPRYHVIHISTGLVIADVEYSDIKHVKETFEQGSWTLRGENTFVLLYDTIEWEMTCFIRYEVIEDD